MIPKDYIEKVYAGLLGKVIGVRLGAPVEPSVWTYEKIKMVYGNITSYIKNYKNFAADDDLNGPIFFLRALYDDAKDRELEPQDVGRAWLNYTRDGIGMFWWGGYGRSTEHTAYMNLKNGISAPVSGSIKQNGHILAEQIGGQIFIDTWGLVWPNNIEKAAEYAGKAASVSHDRNGIFGARFIAACISKAFSTQNVFEIIKAGLSVIPDDCTYAKLVKSVLDFYNKHPEDFRECRDYLEQNWGYDKFPGVCHIIPNAGVCVLSLLYGKGDFARTIEIATMCGWDTDCNAGNVGTIIGVAQGLSGIKEHYRVPVNDLIIASSISGYLNIIDIPTLAKEVAILGYKLAKQDPPSELIESFVEGEIYFDFELPGSTHGFRLSDSVNYRLRHTNEIAYKGKGALEVLLDRVVSGQITKVYYKPFYRRFDFDDERYSPTFAPKAYPGQKVSMKLYLDQWSGREVAVIPYVRNTYTKEDIKLGYYVLNNNKWQDVEFVIPDVEGAMVDEVGIIVDNNSTIKDRLLGRLFIDEFRIKGKAKYTIDFSKQFEEFSCVTPFSHNRGAWFIEGNRMHCLCIDHCEAYTGNYFTRDIRIRALVNPQNGFSHNIAFRVQGAMRGYHVGFSGKNQVSLILNDFGFKPLLTVPYKWRHNKNYWFEVVVKGSCIVFYIDGKKILEYEDERYKYGMFGISSLDIGRAYWSQIEVEEL
ncbi:ADP-ribosylglycohydrolase [Caldicoprobacter guelmensis]|uniref:ADP-ribosylglycohydrolase family protein n=1 Tax=Caldicoprobacter guelmensis TaxID=1170224 RepID=UPI001A9C6F61|nr:ADP-ribosylglycohydrolase family protein [Caldicoprobacter guelmensis]MBM7582963.1 ADP-ribosylglycohydrolase [Caldicoprobacter guelmensis]